jgi:hypothetical protein
MIDYGSGFQEAEEMFFCCVHTLSRSKIRHGGVVGVVLNRQITTVKHLWWLTPIRLQTIGCRSQQKQNPQKKLIMQKLNLSLINSLKSLAILSLVFVFSSCVTKEDDPEPAIVEDITFQVDLIKITGLEIKEGESDFLEIYGAITTRLIRGNITESNELWSTSDDAALSVGLSDVPVAASVTYKVAPENLATSNLEVRADLSDYDGGGTNAPEDLGNEAIVTALSSITTSIELQVVLNDSGGQVVQVTYAITRL